MNCETFFFLAPLSSLNSKRPSWFFNLNFFHRERKKNYFKYARYKKCLISKVYDADLAWMAECNWWCFYHFFFWLDKTHFSTLYFTLKVLIVSLAHVRFPFGFLRDLPHLSSFFDECESFYWYRMLGKRKKKEKKIKYMKADLHNLMDFFVPSINFPIHRLISLFFPSYYWWCFRR